LRVVPKRTNVFQEVVAIIQDHMAGDATVEESALLTHSVTGEPREVDVVLRSTVAGHEVIVSVEATARGRKADTTWVEAMIEKHRNLPTSKLVLVSQAGFTESARAQAEAANAIALTPEDLDSADPAFVVVNALKSLWPKSLSLTPEAAKMTVRRPDGTVLRIRDVPADGLLYADGEEFGTFWTLFQGVFADRMLDLHDMAGVAEITERTERWFTLVYGPPCRVEVGEELRQLYARWEETDPPEMHEVEQIEFHGKATIDVGEIPLHHKRLGDVSYAYGEGEGEVAGQAMLVVASGAAGQEKLTVRPRPERREEDPS
jgi:hypothetical protein